MLVKLKKISKMSGKAGLDRQGPHLNETKINEDNAWTRNEFVWLDRKFF